MRILKANRELLEEEYDPMPLLKSVFEENVKKYKSVADLSPQYINEVFQQFREISKVPERRKRVTQFMDIAEYMIDADTLWELIEDTANAFSVKKLRDDLNDVNSGQENIKLSVACSEEGLVFKGRYEVWITEEDVKSPLQSMILETNRKQDVNTLFESMHLETRREKDETSKYHPAFLEKKRTKEEEQKHLEDLKISFESMNLETRKKRAEEKLKDETSKYHPAFLKKKRTKDETIIYRSPSLEELWSEDEAIQYPRLSLEMLEKEIETALESITLETRHKREEYHKRLKDVKTSLEAMGLETRQRRDLKTSLQSVNLETRQKRDETSKYHPAFLKKKRTKDETIIYRSPSLEELWSEDEAIQYPRLSLLGMREEEKRIRIRLRDRNNDVKLWIKIRMETLSRLNELKDELLEANKKIKRATIARSLTFGLALVGCALFSVYTGGLSMAGSTLIAGVFTTGAASIILLMKGYVKAEVLRRTQLSIYEDQTATYHFKIKVLQLEKDNIPFADNLRKIKLKGIEDLAKVPLEQLISRFVDTESSSLLTAVDKISEFRVILEQELQEVERIQGQHSF